ncbi:MAG: ATP-dependent zinc protease family protein [Acidimicrobiales bacterium]
MTKQKPRLVIGWREWVELPTLCRSPIKAKVDTGARTSSLHAFGLHISGTGNSKIATFEIQPTQRSAAGAQHVSYPVKGFRTVRSSNGRDEKRPVIVVPVRLGGLTWPIEVTLTSRDQMGFRMLLGRSATKRRFVIDPGRSYILSRP